MFVNIILYAVIICYGYSISLNAINWLTLNLPNQLKFNEFRTMNGSGNNIANPEWGAAFAETVRCVDPAFGDGYNSLAGKDRLNPREISNVLFRQFPEDSPSFLSQRDLTQFAWQWGQFIDHDITLISEDQSTDDLDLDIDIYVPCCDVTFDNDCTCAANITMNVFRTAAIIGTGTDPNNPRKIFNDLTSFVDGSVVYGSDDDRADALRAFSRGLMNVSIASNGDELLPLNTNGIANEPNHEEEFFIGGDPRVNEQLGLLAMHTYLVRAHNVLADYVHDSIKATFPNRPLPRIEEDTYQYTKLILTAIIQKITYKDWLPTLFGPIAINQFLGPYSGYDSTVNPGMCAIFSSSAFRLGHTQLPQRLPLRTPKCRYASSDLNITSDLELRDAYFVVDIIKDDPRILNRIVHGFSCTLANEIDTRVTDGVRDFLFESAVDSEGNRIFGTLDLVSLNIQRGRDHGLPDYNTVREMIGLEKFTSFSNISSDAVLNEDIETLYRRDINNIDLFVGLLAEDHMQDGSFGETISKIVLSQFKRTRDGDRFWYENYIETGPLLTWIESVTLKDVLEWAINMDITTLDTYDNVFRNTEAISIFDVPPNGKTAAKQQMNDKLMQPIKDNYSLSKKPVLDPYQILIGILLFAVLALLFGLFVGHQYGTYTNKSYHAIPIDTDTQGSSTDV